jgi:hypothetical protein
MTRDDQTISQSDHNQRHDNGAEFDVFTGADNHSVFKRWNCLDTQGTGQECAAIRYRASVHIDHPC